MEGILNSQQIDQFITQGFIRIDHAFTPEIAVQVRNILWNDLGLDRNDPSTWTKPVVRLGMYSHDSFVASANTPVLHAAFDQLVGEGKWLPCRSMGTFPVRFPSDEDPGDAGWHVDASFPGDDPANFLAWRVNINSKGRGLLMLFLYSDVSERDAPTRIRIGSHADVARALQAEGEAGLRLWSSPANWTPCPSAKSHSLPERQAPYTSAIHSSPTPRSPTTAQGPNSWRNRRCYCGRSYLLMVKVRWKERLRLH
jgi:hypothetical protein